MVNTPSKATNLWLLKTLKLTSGWVLGAVLLLNALPLMAQIERQHGAHVHGEGAGGLAIDTERLSLVLEIPGFNVVGFEHPPNNPAQHTEIENALSLLNAGQWLALDPRGDCEVSHQAVIAEGFGQAATPSESDSGDDHNHHNEHDHHHDHDGDHSHDHDHNHGGEHAQFKIEIEATCQAMDALGWADIDLFTPFPNNERIMLNVLTQNNAFQARLVANETRIDLQ